MLMTHPRSSTRGATVPQHNPFRDGLHRRIFFPASISGPSLSPSTRLHQTYTHTTCDISKGLLLESLRFILGAELRATVRSGFEACVPSSEKVRVCESLIGGLGTSLPDLCRGVTYRHSQGIFIALSLKFHRHYRHVFIIEPE